MGEIIAALPLLLYVSLILFFCGLTRGVWSMHTTVVGIVPGGMLLRILFYGMTTMLSVFFPISPYGAPIVRWINASLP